MSGKSEVGTLIRHSKSAFIVERSKRQRGRRLPNASHVKHKQMENKVEIPAEVKSFALQVARLAAKNGLQKFTGRFSMGWDKSKWREDVHFSWEAGRHNEDAGKIEIFSEFREHLKTVIPYTDGDTET